jgi:hypothetical protein
MSIFECHMVNPIRQMRRSRETLPYGFVHDWQVRFCPIVRKLRQVGQIESSMADDAVFESSWLEYAPQDLAGQRLALDRPAAGAARSP